AARAPCAGPIAARRAAPPCGRAAPLGRRGSADREPGRPEHAPEAPRPVLGDPEPLAPDPEDRQAELGEAEVPGEGPGDAVERGAGGAEGAGHGDDRGIGTYRRTLAPGGSGRRGVIDQ